MVENWIKFELWVVKSKHFTILLKINMEKKILKSNFDEIEYLNEK